MSSEGTEVYREWILNIIDQLRRRKARPDLERICHFVQRRYGVNRAVTEAHVERLVDQGVVIKVVYKRGTSYRNATKSRKKGYGTFVLNSKSTSRKIVEAVQSILKERSESRTSQNEENKNDLGGPVQSSSEVETGISIRDIESWLSSNKDGDDQSEPFMCPIRVVIQRELDAGRLIRLENGNFLPSQSDVKSPGDRPPLPKTVGVIAKRGRPPKRKFPIVRSLSCGDVQTSTTRPEPQVAPVPIMPPHLCDFCQQPADRNKYGQEEELLFCKDCNAKAHPSCMQYSPELAKRARNTAWQCIDCKTCCICSDPGEADCMLFCDACDKGYHMLCHDPKVTEKPQGKWVCQGCVLDGADIDEIDDNFTNMVDSTVRSTDSESISSFRSRSYSDRDALTYYQRESVSPSSRKYMKEDKKEEERYPYVGNWSIAEISEFFKRKGFEEQAEAFEDQEIDGQSLLLLKRSDVLTGLALKLGPALKIYNIVMKLQSQTET